MADDGVISIGTKVNIGPLQTDMAKAQAAVVTASENMAKAQLNAKQASDALSAAYKKFGADATAGSEQAKAALLAHRQALNDARDAVGLWTRELKIADAELLELTQGEEKVAVSTRALNAELGMLKGNFESTRAASALLQSSFPGLASAMSAALPIAGAVAAVDMLGKAAGAAHHLYDEYVNLRSVVDQVNKEISEAEGEGIRLSNEHIEALRKQRVLQAELAGPKAGRMQRGEEAGYKFDSGQNQNDLAIASAKLDELNGKLKDFQQRSKAILHPEDAQYGGKPVPTQDATFASTEIPKVQEEIANAAAKVRNLREEQANLDAEQRLKQIQESEKLGTAEGSAYNKAAQEKLRAMETALEEEKAQGALGAFAERAYWQQRIGAFQQGSTEYLSVISKIATLTGEAHKQLEEGVKKYKEYQSAQYDKEGAEVGAKAYNELILAQAEDVLRTGERWKQYNDEVAKGAEINAANSASIAEATLKSREASGAITKLGADKALAAIKTQEYTDKIKALRAELDKLNSDPNLTQAQKATQGQGIQNQISGLQGQQAAQGIQSQSQINQQIAQPYQNAFNTINQSWLQLQGKLIFGTRNVGAAFANMGVSILTSFASTAEQYAARWAEKELLTLVLHQTTNAAKVSSDAASAAATRAATSASNVASVESYAAVAAAAAAASVAAIPLVGWAMAPGVAAGTFASTSAYSSVAAFDVGGIIPGSGAVPIIGHGGERVLTVEQTQLFERMVNNSTSNTANASITNNFNGSSDRMLQRQIMRNSTTVVKATQRGLRKMGGR